MRLRHSLTVVPAVAATITIHTPAWADPTPSTTRVVAPLDGVAALVCLVVEGRRPAAGLAATFALGDLVGRLRDHGPDSTTPQTTADRAGRIRLVREDGGRCGAWSADRPGHPQAGHDLLERGCVFGLAGCEDEGQWPAAAVGGEVDLRRQSAAGSPKDVIVRLAGRGPF